MMIIKNSGLLFLILTFCSFLVSNVREVEKRPLAITDFAAWKGVKNQIVSNDGKLVVFSVPKENAAWVAFLTDMKKPEKKSDKMSEKKVDEPKAKAGTDQSADQKSQLVLFHATSGGTVCFQNVTEYYYAPFGHSITFICQTKDSTDRAEVLTFDTKTRKSAVIFSRTGTAKKITSNEQGSIPG